jgi:YlmC/YmxH family sporulation protein
VKLAHLKKRRVINVYNGNFMGYISDIIIAFPNGNIETLIVKPNFIKRITGFFSINSKIYISWSNIISIGKDVILVNIIDN